MEENASGKTAEEFLPFIKITDFWITKWIEVGYPIVLKRKNRNRGKGNGSEEKEQR